jgi:flagellar biosynthesis protein FlhB
MGDKGVIQGTSEAVKQDRILEPWRVLVRVQQTRQGGREMTKRDVMEIAIKVMGLAFLFFFFQSIPVVGAAFLSKEAKYIANKTVYILFSCLATLLYLGFALLFLRAGRRIAEMLMSESGKDSSPNREPLAPHAHLHFWVRILGLFFFVSGVGSLVSDFLQAALTVQNTFWWTRIMGHVIQLALALVFIFRTKVVTQWVEKGS